MGLGVHFSLRGSSKSSHSVKHDTSYFKFPSAQDLLMFSKFSSNGLAYKGVLGPTVFNKKTYIRNVS